MADITISGLPNATILTGSERVPMDQGATTVDASTQAIANLATKATVGLGSVDNTSDADKPLSSATLAALINKVSVNDASVSNAREWTAATVTEVEARAGTGTTRRAWTAQAVRWNVLEALTAFRDANRVYVSPSGNDANNGTSPGEPLRTLAAAAAAAQPGDLVEVGPGTYTEAALPIRWKRNIGLLCSGLRNTTVRPAAGQEMKDIFKVDSGFWCWGLEFAGHQANSATGDLSWAISFDELADNRGIGAVGLGAYILKSPYIQNCSSITAEDDSGTAGSVSTGDTGGGILVDGSKCAANSPIRSMVVDSYTQVNLGGPGCLVTNDGYAQLVSFFGTFCQYHVKTLTGGQVNLSGGGTSDFGIYGLVADGYSPRPVFTGKSRVTKFGAARIEKAVTINHTTNTFTCTAHGLSANDQVVFQASMGTLPAPLATGTTYFVRSASLTADTFTISATSGGSILDITEPGVGTYAVIRQGVTEVDVIGFSANRLGRQVKYPTAGSLGANGRPVTISAVSGTTFAITLDTSTIAHEYVGGGTVTVGGTSYDVVAATYNNTTGATTVRATGYTPTVGASVTLAGLSFICNSSSRPNAGQLMFPQLVFPRNASTGAAESKTFTYTRTSVYTFTYTEAASPSGPDHEYVSGGTVAIGGTDYGVAGAVYDKTSGLTTITTVTALPGASTGSVTVNGLAFICPTSGYIVTSSVPIDASGNAVANDSSSRAGYRVQFFSGTNGGLRNSLAVDQVLDFRQRSQISAPSHTFEYVGSGTNYNALPWNGGVPIPANKIVETNNGRVYSSNTDELGNFAVGTQFTVDGTSGAVTINTDQFNLSGLNFIGPFSRNGGISTVGEQLREVSNNTSLIASTGAPDGNTAPTQFAVKSYASSQFLQAVTVTAGQPISVSDTSTVDAQGFQTRNRNITLSLNVANGLVRLDGSALVPVALLPAATTLAAGAMSSSDKAKLDGIASGATAFSEAQVRSTVLTGYASGAGTITAGDSVLSAIQKLNGNVAGAGTGSVTSVGLSLPSLFSVSGSPITAAGTLTAALATQSANLVWAGPVSGSAAAPAFRALVAADLPAAQWSLRQTVTAASGTYALDVTAANEFVTAAAIAGTTTINLSNLASIPTNYVWRGVLSFSYTSGTINWFAGNSGYSVRWDGGSAITPTASEVEKVVIEVVGGSTVIEVAALKGRAA